MLTYDKRYEQLVKAEAKIEMLERLLGISAYVSRKDLCAVLDIEPKTKVTGAVKEDEDIG